MSQNGNEILESLAVKHSSYCSDCNYYSKEDTFKWSTATAFLLEWSESDPEVNMVIRWDVNKAQNSVENQTYDAQLFMVEQRKGRYSAHIIESIEAHEAHEFQGFLKKCWFQLNRIWAPIS